MKSKVVIDGIKKISVLGIIKYHQIRHSVFHEINYHPEVLKGLEILHYHTEQNLPIEKELVFKLVPELFQHEINKLDYEDRVRFQKPRIQYMRADGDLLDVDVQNNLAANRLDAYDTMKDKAMRMEMYLFEQSQDLFNFYLPRLQEETQLGGHVGMAEYLMMLDLMDDDKMKDWERRFMLEVSELRNINEDIHALN